MALRDGRKGGNVHHIHHRIRRGLHINSLCIFLNKRFHIFFRAVNSGKADAIFGGYMIKKTNAASAVGQSTGFDYSRLQNPTREHLEKVVASLENGVDALAFSSGMAAITMLTTSLRHFRVVTRWN